MFCVRREDRESEWLALAIDDSVSQSDTPQAWPLHEAVEYINWYRTQDYPVAVYRIDEEDSVTYPTHKVYPSADMQRVNA